MSTLKTLNLTALPKHSSSDPVVSRRAKLLKQLEQQLALAKTPLFVVTAQNWRKDEAGNKQLVEKHPDIIERRSKSEYKVYGTDNFHDKFYRMMNNHPSRTIVSHLAKDGNSFIHPTQNRSITPREAARIQTFPDDYIFFGSRSAQFIQIGNAVPPVLAEAIAKVILKFLQI